MIIIEKLEHENSMLRNKAELLQEDIDCVHMWLDDKKIPRSDDIGRTYSIVGRIAILTSK